MTVDGERRVTWPALLALILVVAYAACFTALSLVRYLAFHSRSFDLAIVVRMLWGLRRGDLHEFFTDQPWIAYHFEPVMLPLALVDGLLPTGAGLLVLQTLALAAAAWPAYRLASRHLGPWAGTAMTAALLLHPVLGQVNVSEFHPVALAVAPGLWLLDALDANRPRQVVAAAVLTACCREDGLVFVALAFLSVPGALALERRRRWWVVAGCLAAYAAYAFVLQPRLGRLGSVRAHFGDLGRTPAEIVATAAAEPLRVLAHLTSAPKREYLLALLLPLAALPLLAPRRALPALFTVGLNLLSGFEAAHRVVDSHYSALALPGLFAGAVFGAQRLRRLAAARWATGPPAAIARVAPLCLVVGCAIFAAGRWGALPGARGHFREDYVLGPRSAAIRSLIAPMRARPEASVSVPIDVVAHLARRRAPHVFPAGLPADQALVDLGSQAVIGASAEAYRAHLRNQVRRALASGMVISAESGPLLVLRRR